MVTLLKIGGSLITDKKHRSTLRPEVLEQLAREILFALNEQPYMPLIIGHGSGSFGHFEANEHNTINGVATIEQWQGFASVNRIAGELNFYVASAFADKGIPIFRVQPSASVIAREGIIQNMEIQPIIRAVDNGLVPLVYGDVAFDEALGGTIVSTETVFRYLTSKLPVKRILLLGEVDGVYDEKGKIIPHITPKNFDKIRTALKGSDGVDVTGGMSSKVQDMLQLAIQAPYPDVYILNGKVKNRVSDALLGKEIVGTLISQD